MKREGIASDRIPGTYPTGVVRQPASISVLSPRIEPFRESFFALGGKKTEEFPREPLKKNDIRDILCYKQKFHIKDLTKMTRGKHPFRTTEFSAGLPHETVVDPEPGNTICRFDAATPWFGESRSPAVEYSDSRDLQSDDEIGDAASRMDEHGTQKAKHTLPRISADSRISSLKKTKIKLRGKVSELFALRPIRPGVEPEVEAPPTERPEPGETPQPITTEKSLSEPAASIIEQMEVKPPDVIVKVLPTPVKRHRSPKIELASQPARPLKVIRRRREEAPKVFETASKDFPKSMLEGIKASYEEETDSQSD